MVVGCLLGVVVVDGEVTIEEVSRQSCSESAKCLDRSGFTAGLM